jgi:hypothetical protein
MRIWFMTAFALTACVEPGVPPAPELLCQPVEISLLAELDHEAFGGEQVPQAEHGAALGDLDGDGDLDILVAWEGGAVVVINEGGTFVVDFDWTVDGNPLPGATSAHLADLDGDGDLDGWLGRSRDGPDLLLFQTSLGRFESVPLLGSETGSWSGAFVDVDVDGDLDLVIGSRPWSLSGEDFLSGDLDGEPNHLYLQGPEGWTKKQDAFDPATNHGLTFQALMLDANGDGIPDVFVANDGGHQVVPNQLLLGDGSGRFEESEDCLCDQPMYAMGAAAAAVNDDLLPDLYVTNIGPQLLLMSSGPAQYVDTTLSSGVLVSPEAAHLTSWGAGFADLDRDGWNDLWVTFGRLQQGMNEVFGNLPGTEVGWADVDEQHSVVLRGLPGATFERLETPEIDKVFGRGRSVAFGDLDDDGDLDVVETGKHYVRLWEVSGGCPMGLTVAVDGPPGNAHGFGTRVSVVRGDRRQTAWMLPSRMHSADAPGLVFGLGVASSADEVRVLFPDGSERILEDVQAGDLRIEWSP